MNNSASIPSKSVFAPRGASTYTPKWSIVVLAIACLGVLKLNGPASKPSAKPGSVTPAYLTPTIQNELRSMRRSRQPTVGDVGGKSLANGNEITTYYGMPGDYSSDLLEPEKKKCARQEESNPGPEEW